MKILDNTKKFWMKFNLFQLIYYYSRFSGQWSFSIIYSSNGNTPRARVGFFEALWPISIICFNIMFSLDAYNQIIAGLEKHAISIRSIVNEMIDICLSSFIVINIVLNVINRKKLVGILGKFKTFDKEVRCFFENFS